MIFLILAILIVLPGYVYALRCKPSEPKEETVVWDDGRWQVENAKEAEKAGDETQSENSVNGLPGRRG